MNPRMPDPRNVAFVSSGNAEEDAKEAASIRRQLCNEAEGLCPNGCAPMTWPESDNVAYCAVCGFHGYGMTRADYEVKR